jgi:prepilin-type N-terminal cleavage/methylation domain-containing protein
MTGLVRSRHRAFTLIEVVAALTLMSMLLVGTVMAFNRHQRQIDSARLRQSALDATDALMSEWFSRETAFPENGSGIFESEAELHWRTRTVSQSLLAGKFPVITLEFSVFHSGLESPVFQMELIREKEDFVSRNSGVDP